LMPGLEPGHPQKQVREADSLPGMTTKTNNGYKNENGYE
jgi:hypothetical protein